MLTNNNGQGAKWMIYIKDKNKLIDSNMDCGRSVCESAIFVVANHVAEQIVLLSLWIYMLLQNNA